MPGEFRVPGSLGYRYTPGEGVWKERREVLDWCPVVKRQAMRVDPVEGTGQVRITDRTLTVIIGDELAHVTDADLSDGKAWAKFSLARGVGDRNIRDVLRNVIGDQAARLPRTPLLPGWSPEGRLILPPADMLPSGYGLVSGTAQEWADMLRVAGESGRIALTAGLAVYGLFVRPLARQSFVNHLVGNSSEGKTTAQRVAAAFFGNPSQVILSWRVTRQGPGAWLRDLHLFTGFRNDSGAADLTAKAWENHILSWTEGAGRDQSSREGRHMTAPGDWHGCLSSTGNDGLVDLIANEAIAARVVEITTPLTNSAEHAKDVKRRTLTVYGHGLAALIERGPTPLEFATWIDKAETDLGTPQGGPGQRLAEHIAGGIAGAYLLGELAGVSSFGESALMAGREVLAELLTGLAERGARPGDRLLVAIADRMAQYPDRYPTRADYTKALAFGPVKDIEGWSLAGDSIPGADGADVAILMRPVKIIAEDAEIRDRMIAIKDLRKRGLLAPGTGGNLAKVIRVGDTTKRTYVLSGVVPVDPPEHGYDFPGEAVTTSVTTFVTTPDQESYDCYDFSETQVYTREGEQPEPGQELPATDLQDGRSDELVQLVKITPPDGGPKRGRPCYVIKDVHPAEDAVTGSERVSQDRVTGAVTDAVTGSDQERNGCNGFSETQVYTREGEQPEPGRDLPATDLQDGWTRASELATCSRCGNGRTLVRDPDGLAAHPACSPPATAQVSAPVTIPPAKSAPEEKASSRAVAPRGRRAAPTLAPDPDGPGLDEQAHNIRRALKGVGRTIDEPMSHAVLGEWLAATNGTHFVDWFGDTGVSAYARLRALAGNEARGIIGAQRIESPLAAAMSADAVLHLDFVNPGHKPTARHAVTEWDVNGQFLSAAAIELGHGEPVHVENPRSIKGYLKSPGYLRLASDLHIPADLLPHTRHAFHGIRKGRTLASTTARYLDGRGIELDVSEVVTWPQPGINHRRHLDSWVRLFREARKTLLAHEGEAAALALIVQKNVCSVTIGGWIRSAKNRSDFMDRGWSDLIIAEAWVRALIGIEKAGEAGNPVMGMRRDSAWFLAADMPFEPAGLPTRDDSGKPATQLGKWKLSRFTQVTPEIITAHTGQSAEVLNSAIKAAHEAREGRS